MAGGGGGGGKKELTFTDFCTVSINTQNFRWLFYGCRLNNSRSFWPKATHDTFPES